jgi:hypothetical protein
MNAQHRSIKLFLILVFLVATIAPLAACTPAVMGAVEIGVEPTPTPETLTYTNENYGFRFDYPATWTLAEEDHRVILNQGPNRLSVMFRWVNETIDPGAGRTGMGAGTPIYSGKLNFMGQIIPENVVELEHLRKYVMYGETQPIKLGDLAFNIVLEDLETDYMTLDLPQSAIDEAGTILESFEQIPATGSPPEGVPATSTIEGAPPTTNVIAWLGHIASLPEVSRYDDMVMLSPQGTGEFGLVGATPELEAEIVSLRDSEGPNEFVHFWGTLFCGGVDDYNDCQLSVDRMQYGANYSEQDIADWLGTITTHTFNGGLSYVFVLDGAFPVWYSVNASQDEALRAQIQHYQETGDVVELSGKLMIGVPDVNGSRIEVSSIQPRSMAGPRPDAENSERYENTGYGFSFRYPSSMSVEERPNRVIVTQDSPSMAVDEGSNRVIVTQDSLQLTIAYRRADEDISISDVGDLTGQFHPYTEVYFLDQFVQPSLNIVDGYINGVYLGGPGVELGDGTPLRFVISLAKAHGGHISNAEVDQMLTLLETFELSK